VWFLAGTMATEPVVRRCRIPARVSLFFPTANIYVGALPSDPAPTHSEAYVRSIARCRSREMAASIDDRPIRNLIQYFTGPSGSQSPIFRVNLPPRNILGAESAGSDAVLMTPIAEQGYYVFVYPLPPGTHTIKWSAAGCVSYPQNVTYRLVVE
jgi:hypothetical protein